MQTRRRRQLIEDHVEKGRTIYCHYCYIQLEPDDATVDHLVPKSRGGTNDRSNLVLSCKRCNEEKSNLTDSEYVNSHVFLMRMKKIR
jgi:5-methylcytosine-specific restriction endonuclease McrA